MIANRISLDCFRSYKVVSIEPCPGVNILYGNNAQGKTNLIEALFLFTGSRSFRGAKDSELLKIGESSCRLELCFEAKNRNNTAKIEIKPQRKAYLNGVSLESPTRLAGEFCAVVFSPEHLGLVKEGPQLRRKFIDAAICQLWPKHYSHISAYLRVLSQRNTLLKDIPRHSSLLDTLDIWDQKLSDIGSQLIFTRLRYLKRLSEKTSGIYKGISDNEQMKIYYKAQGIDYPDLSEDKTKCILSIRSLLYDGIRKNLSSDIDSGYTHLGPHRDDLEIEIDHLSARLYGSQGQQRSAVLALKLAEAAILNEQTGEPPVLLLDDVMSELDKKRQDYILNHIGGWQVFITCCDPSVFSSLESGFVFHVSGGKIIKTEGF